MFCQDQHLLNYPLQKTIIFKTCLSNIKEQSEWEPLESCSVPDYPNFDALSQKLDETKISNDPPKKYMVLDASSILPEYFVEYSLETDLGITYSQLERLLIDIAFSNRLSHADMPMIVYELSSKMKCLLMVFSRLSNSKTRIEKQI